MDFVIGILMFMVLILILINFTSISMSDTKGGNCAVGGSNGMSGMFGGMGIFGNSNINNNQYPNQMQNYNIPSPILSNAPTALNNKFNINEQTYDYRQHFFV